MKHFFKRISTSSTINLTHLGYTWFGRNIIRMENYQVIKKGSFWWRDNLKLLDGFKGIALVNLQDGSTCFFWTDLWGGHVNSQSYPELFSFVKNKLLSLKKVSRLQPFHHLFHLPLSEEAFDPMLQLEARMTLQQTTAENDVWTYIWGSLQFSSQKAYKHLMGHTEIHPTYKWLWNSCCQNKHKIFFWLLIKDRLSTRNILRKKRMALPSYACVLCGSDTEETLEHLFFQCPLAVACWGLIQVQIENSAGIFEVVEDSKAQLHTPIFMSLVILLCWTIWTTRNHLIFQGVQPSLQRYREVFRKELLLLQHRVGTK